MMLTVEIHTSWYRSLLVKNDTSEGHVLEYCRIESKRDAPGFIILFVDVAVWHYAGRAGRSDLLLPPRKHPQVPFPSHR